MAVNRICATSPELAAKLCDSELAIQTDKTTSGSSVSSSSFFEGWRNGIRQNFERSLAAEAD
jgi:hypothetical protein